MKTTQKRLLTALFLTSQLLVGCAQNELSSASKAAETDIINSQVSAESKDEGSKGEDKNVTWGTLPAVSVNVSQDESVINLLNTEVDDLWGSDFNHYQNGLLENIANAITFYAEQGDLQSEELNKLSYYLRIYSSFGPDKDWSENTAASVNRALISLQAMPGFYQITPTTARLHENYAVALYRLYFLAPLQNSISDHVIPLSNLVNIYGTSELPKDIAIDYALWEILRATAIIPYEARRKNKAEHISAILYKSELQNTLLSFIGSKNAILDGNNWPKQHATWALGNYYNLYNKQYWNEYYTRSDEERKQLDDDKISLPFEKSMDDLDNTLWAALAKNSNGTTEQLKHQFSVPYVVTTFRGKSECEEGTLANRCITPTIEQALPIKHICSDSLYILTQEMTKQQLNDSCQQLISQESTFHEKLQTKRKPVANDYNDKLRVVVFDNAAEYNKYGQLVFDINTDNGGMYIEGTTQNPENIATFYSYEHFWVRPEFKVWNLNHEYMHYLDGRFIKYDTFNHFPGQMVWWSEGLAEYISKGDENPKAFKKMAETEQEKWPNLLDVFNTEYKDGTDRVYKWGYLAVRYMFENYHDEYLQMAHFLQTDYFDGYKKLIDDVGKNDKDGFSQWLTIHKVAIDNTDNGADAKNVTNNRAMNKPRQFYRYTYKDYLQPKHLLETPEHMHWQYWHENALSKH
jgi:microbial collagenase